MTESNERARGRGLEPRSARSAQALIDPVQNEMKGHGK